MGGVDLLPPLSNVEVKESVDLYIYLFYIKKGWCPCFESRATLFVIQSELLKTPSHFLHLKHVFVVYFLLILKPLRSFSPKLECMKTKQKSIKLYLLCCRTKGLSLSTDTSSCWWDPRTETSPCLLVSTAETVPMFFGRPLSQPSRYIHCYNQ
jgi:hypothetical protein